MLQTDNRTSVAYIMKQGGTRVPDITSNSEKNFRVLPGNAVSFNSTLHTGTIQRHSRRAVQSQSPSGMASQQNSFRNDLSKTGSTRHRPICLPNVSSRFQLMLGWIFPPPALIPQVLHHLQSIRRPVPAGDPNFGHERSGNQKFGKRALQPPLKIPNLQSNLIDLRTNPSSTRGGQVKFGGMDGTGWLKSDRGLV
ncbi:hypothetical protein ACJJTC_015664 [Scirpophaga incertulas]